MSCKGTVEVRRRLRDPDSDGDTYREQLAELWSVLQSLGGLDRLVGGLLEHGDTLLEPSAVKHPIHSGLEPRDLDQMHHQTIGRMEQEQLCDGVGLVRVELADLWDEDE